MNRQTMEGRELHVTLASDGNRADSSTEPFMRNRRRIAGARFRELLESEQLLEHAALALAEPFAIPPSLRLTTTELQLDDLYVQGMLSEIADVQRRELERLERLART